MTLRSRSWVMGRGVAMFSICSAMALASKIPTQMGSTRSPPLSFRITIGRLVIGSTISPLIVISISMMRSAISTWLNFARQAVRPGSPDDDRQYAPDPRRCCPPCTGGSWKTDDGVSGRPARQLAGPATADRIDEDVLSGAEGSLVEPRLDRALARLELDDPGGLLVLADVVRHPLR